MPPELGGGAGHDVEAAVVAFHRRQLAHVWYASRSACAQDARRRRWLDATSASPPSALVEAVGAALARCASACAARSLLHQRLRRLAQGLPSFRKIARRTAGSLRKSSVAFPEHVGVALCRARSRARPARWPASISARARHACRTSSARVPARPPCPAHPPPGGRACCRPLTTLPSRVEVHVGGGGQRGLLAEVDEGLAAVGQLQRHEPAAAEVARRRIHDRQRIAHRHRGVDGVAAAASARRRPRASRRCCAVTTMPFCAATGAADAARDGAIGAKARDAVTAAAHVSKRKVFMNLIPQEMRRGIRHPRRCRPQSQAASGRYWRGSFSASGTGSATMSMPSSAG